MSQENIGGRSSAIFGLRPTQQQELLRGDYDEIFLDYCHPE